MVWVRRALENAGARCPAAVWILLLFVAAYALWAVSQVWRYRDVFPFSDGVTAEIFIRFLWDRGNPFSLFRWYDNEHRPVFPLLVFILDHYLTGSRGTVAVVLMQACNLAIALLPVCLWRGSAAGGARPGGPAAGRPALGRPMLVAAVSVAAMFWPAHYVNLVWPKQLHMYCALVAGTAALVLVLRALPVAGAAGRAPGWGRCLAVAALLFVAGFSFAYGVIFACVVLLAALLGFGLGRLSAAAGAAVAVSVAVYAVLFAGLSQFGGSVANLASVPDIAIFVLRYVGAPVAVAAAGAAALFGLQVSPHVLIAAAGVLGALAALWYLANAVLFARRWFAGRAAEVHPAAWFFLAVGAVVFATALVTAASRLDYPPDFAVNVMRYYVVSIYFWVAAFSQWVLSASRGLKGPSVVAAAVAVVVLLSGAGYVDGMRRHATDNRVEGVAGMSGLSDLIESFWLPGMLPDLYGDYARTGSLLYRHPWARLRGHPLKEAGLAVDDAACRGGVAAMTAVEGEGVQGGYRMTGEIARPGPDVAWLVVTDARRTVVGFGAGHMTRVDVPRTWTAFARDAVPPLTVYGVLGDNMLCRIGEAAAVTEAPARLPVRSVATDFESARRAPRAGKDLSCPPGTGRVRWVTGDLLCMPER